MNSMIRNDRGHQNGGGMDGVRGERGRGREREGETVAAPTHPHFFFWMFGQTFPCCSVLDWVTVSVVCRVREFLGNYSITGDQVNKKQKELLHKVGSPTS
jgi:hypothetical protein